MGFKALRKDACPLLKRLSFFDSILFSHKSAKLCVPMEPLMRRFSLESQKLNTTSSWVSETSSSMEHLARQSSGHHPSPPEQNTQPPEHTTVSETGLFPSPDGGQIQFEFMTTKQSHSGSADTAGESTIDAT